MANAALMPEPMPHKLERPRPMRPGCRISQTPATASTTMATATELKLRVITPERTLLEQSAAKVTFQGVDGSYGILPNHAPLMTALAETGLVVITGTDGSTTELGVSGGFAEVRDHSLTLVCEEGFHADEITPEEAAEAERVARESMSGQRQLSVDEVKAEAALRKALLKEMLGRRRGGTGTTR